MTAPHIARGAAAEALAARYLEYQGLAVVGRNLRCRGGEIDLVCLHGDELVIVEVRLRACADFGGALASVSPFKRRKLLRATQYHWQRRPQWRTRRLRFDVVGVQDDARVTWIRDAFRAT